MNETSLRFFLFTLSLCFLVSTKALGIEPPEYLFHWTNNFRFDGYKEEFQDGLIPLRPSVPDKDGMVDYFFGASPHLMSHPNLYTWSDIVGGMGSNKHEFYARFDVSSGNPKEHRKPRLIILKVNPESRVLRVQTQWNQRFTQITTRKPIESLDGYDLVYHEHFSSPTATKPSLREWIAVSQNAALESLYRYQDIAPFVQEGYLRIEEESPIDSFHVHADFNSPYFATRAKKVLHYILTGRAPANGRDTGDCQDSVLN